MRRAQGWAETKASSTFTALASKAAVTLINKTGPRLIFHSAWLLTGCLACLWPVWLTFSQELPKHSVCQGLFLPFGESGIKLRYVWMWPRPQPSYFCLYTEFKEQRSLVISACLGQQVISLCTRRPGALGLYQAYLWITCEPFSQTVVSSAPLFLPICIMIATSYRKMLGHEVTANAPR